MLHACDGRRDELETDSIDLSREVEAEVLLLLKSHSNLLMQSLVN